jgi:hypothetical protein
MDAGAAALAEAVPQTCWPCEVPGQEEAESAVASALSTRVADAGAIVTRVASEVSDIERNAFAGLALADAALLKAAAGLRLRLATALESAPDRGEFDADAVQQLLAKTDAILAALAQESACSTGQVASAIGTIRTDLVRDAIRVSEAHQRLANPAAGATLTPARAAQVRLLSNESDQAGALTRPSRRSTGLWVVLALAVLAAAGYHVNHRYQLQRATSARARVDGAPERVAAGSESAAGQLIFTPQGAPLTAAELQQLAAAQKARGRVVVERAPGVYIIQRNAGPEER